MKLSLYVLKKLNYGSDPQISKKEEMQAIHNTVYIYKGLGRARVLLFVLFFGY